MLKPMNQPCHQKTMEVVSLDLHFEWNTELP